MLWELTFAAPGQAPAAAYNVSSLFWHPAAVPRVAVLPTGLNVENQDEGPGELPGASPTQGSALTVASAVAIAAAQAGSDFDHVRGLRFVAPTAETPASIAVEGRKGRSGGAAGSPVILDASVTLDAADGSALRVVLDHQDTHYGAFDVTSPHVGNSAGSSGAPPPSLVTMGLAMATVAGMALLVGLGAGGNLTVAYARLAKADLLDHPVREGIVDLVRREPGANFTTIQDKLGIGNGAAWYHLAVLERGGKVTCIERSRSRRYYLAGSEHYRAMQQLAALRSPAMRAVYEAIYTQPGVMLQDVSARLRVTPPAAHRHVKKLKEAGL
ncbi:MAG: hypothetical protein LC624_08270, partial [Halobacteriales archaeon]|nr:hypothetical protein [Halobacteriales archaeon]